MEKQKAEGKENKKKISTALLLLIIAIVAFSAVTIAWLSVTDNIKLRNMVFDITTGSKLRFDLDELSDFESYNSTLSFYDIQQRILEDTGIDITQQSMEPVTTSDCQTFTFENGTVASYKDGYYIQFTLHFMAKDDMYVHLTSEDGSESSDEGTLVSSSNQGTVNSIRIGFLPSYGTYKSVEEYVADGETAADAKEKVEIRDDFLSERQGIAMVYDPDMGNSSEKSGEIITFGIPTSSEMVYNNTNSLFYLEAGVDTPVIICIWIEGTDEDCTNSIKASDYSISMRFVGTDEHNICFN